MPKFNCKLCNYTTYKSSNYTKHINTKKHRNNINIHSNNNIKSNKQQIAIKSNKEQQIATNSNKSINYLQQVLNNDNTNVNNENICQYCYKKYNNNRCLHNHFLKSCLEIPDKIKNRLIIKHNSNPRTKHKLELVQSIQKTSKIINNTQNNIIQHNTIQNNTIKLNPFGEETLDHISYEELNQIIDGHGNVMGLLKNKLDVIDANNNSYLDLRNNYAFYYDKDNNIKIEKIYDFIMSFCDIYMEVLKKMTQDNPKKFDRLKKNIFDETYNIYFCIINKHNFDDMEYIEQQHKELKALFNDNVKIAMLNSNMKSKVNLEICKKEFNKIY